MEKYKDFSSETNKHLDGILTRLVVEYETKNDLHIYLEYDDKADNRYEYEMILNKDTKVVEFIKHEMLNIKANVHLNRVIDFEEALKEILFN